MRRFLVWTALSALVGLLLAGGGYWAYWNFYARFQPVLVDRNQAQIQQLLDEATWLSAGGGGQPLYIIGYRDSAAMQRYEREEIPKLRAGGVEARVIVFARADREGLTQSTAAERATVAELWLTRDWTLYQRWTATPSRQWTAAGIPLADNNLARLAVVDAGRDFVDRLSGLLNGAGLQVRYPLIIWRDRDGYLKACACADARSWTFIRDDLDAPDRAAVDTPPPVAEAPQTGTAPPALPYPNLQAPPAATPGLPAPGATTPPAATPAPTTPSQPRPAPQPKKDEETTFY